MKYYNYIWKTSERDNPNIEKIINFDNFQNNIQKEEIIICLFYELENKELFFEKDLNFVFTFDNNKVNNLSNQDNLELKRSNIIAMMLALSMLFGLGLTSCAKKPQDLESYINSNDDVKQELQQTADDAGMTIDIKGNEITYSTDLSKLEDVKEETIKEPEMVEKLQDALDGQKDTFVALCKELEEKTELSGIKMVVNYTYGDEVLATQTFSAEG